ncbi:MAG: toxin TcdB middle/N-terminal domain-containing protein [Myxococcota bacterium]
MRTLRAASRAALVPFVAFATLAATAPAHAQTGVSDDRISLPDGPGSLEGLGDDAIINPNMGQMSYAIPIDVPAGFPGVSPSLTLGYSSGAGNGVLGLGWTFPVQSIERLTVRGVPKYVVDDEFIADGAQLVLVDAGSGTNATRTYRARQEGQFTRYQWHAPGSGASAGQGGYWTAELADGRVNYYGADATGATTGLDAARLGSASGTFRWLLVATVDPWGHAVKYGYESRGGTSLLTDIGWVFDDEGKPQYEVTLSYGSRPDTILTANGGFEESLEHRLTGIAVHAHDQVIRSYVLDYDSDLTADGMTRLAKVTLKGQDGSTYPGIQTFTYSRSLGAVCTGLDCQKPFAVVMNSNAAGNALGVSLKDRHATLIDMNGDGLPDLVDTSVTGGKHRIFANVLAADGEQHFAAAKDSAVGLENEHQLSNPFVQVLDADGDGFVDIMNASSGLVLYNKGGGDWAEKKSVWATDSSGLPNLSSDFDSGDNELRTMRFIDYNNDKKIDLIRSSGLGDNNVTAVYRNTGSGFSVDENVDSLGVGFENDGLELNDINGDGLLDAVLVTTSSVRYRLNHGWGHWADWRDLTSVSFTQAEAEQAELEDMNGDGLADLVLVTPSAIRIWTNRNGASFDSEVDLTDADVDGALPSKGANDVVLFADMNGNGSSDVVWVTSGGEVSFVELFPVKPNLLAQIDNGLGLVTDVTYTTAAHAMAVDGGTSAWKYKVPFGSLVVDSIDTWDRTTGVHSKRQYAYHDGYFDGTEKMFRGFESVEESWQGDESQQDGEARYRYDIGASDSYHAGLLMETEAVAAGESLQWQQHAYAECDLSDVPDGLTPFPVRFVCPTTTTVELREGGAASDYVRVETEKRYDDLGQVVTNIDHGVVGTGPDGTGACEACARADGEYGAPCGAQCLGDERWVHKDYVAPADMHGRWMRNKVWRERRGADEGVVSGTGTFSETDTYYDGDAFVGLPQGQLDQGFVTRVTTLRDAGGAVVATSRFQHDDDGNVVVDLDPMADASATGAAADHRTRYGYSDDGLRVATIDVPLGAANGNHTLRRQVRYDGIWDKVSVSTDWQVLDGETLLTTATSASYAYDVFGRVKAIVKAGDSVAMPTIEYAYEPGTPSRTWVKTRTTAGQPTDLASIKCSDGRGRTYQQRDQTAPGHFEVTGFETVTAQNVVRDRYQPYVSTSDACDDAPPEGALRMRSEVDAIGRPTVTHVPATSGDPTSKLVYFPLSTEAYGLGWDDAASPHHDAPVIRKLDGLGRLVAVGRTPAAGQTPEWFTVTYDALGNIARVTDPMGHAKIQTWDRMGRVTKIVDPDRGTITMTYDDAGHEIAKTDAGGTTKNAYDVAGRLTAKWVDGAEETTKIEYLWDLPGECPEGVCERTANMVVGVRYPTPWGTATDWQGYDARGRLAHLVRQVAGHSLQIDTAYDDADRIIATTYPGGKTIAYTLDGRGGAKAVPGFVTSITKGSRGEVTEVAFANGVTLFQDSDAQGRPTSFDVKSAGGNLLAGYTYTYDSAGLIASIVDRVTADADPSGSAKFEYDAFDRLKSAQLDPGRGMEETLDYVYDAADNILERTSSLGDQSPEHDGTRTLDPDHAHAVGQIGDVAMGYDDTGKMIQRGDTSFDFDGFGRLVDAQVGGKSVSEHVYGRDENRVWSRSGGATTWYLSDDFFIEDGVGQFYLTLGDQTVAHDEYVATATLVLSDMNADDQINAADAWLASQAASGTTHSDVDELLASSAAQGLVGGAERKTFLHRDHVDSLVAATDESGQVVERTNRYPYGEERWSSTNAGEKSGFTDKLEDKASGLVHIGMRQYDAWLGRWNSPDVMFEKLDNRSLAQPWEAMGAYAYIRDNPVNAQDETGAITFTDHQWGAVSVIMQQYIHMYTGGASGNPQTLTNQAWALGVIGDIKGSSERQFMSDGIEFMQVHRQAIAEQITDMANEAFTADEYTDSMQLLDEFISANSAYDAADADDEDDAPYVPLAKAKPIQKFQVSINGNFSDNLKSLALGNEMDLDNVIEQIGGLNTPSGDDDFASDANGDDAPQQKMAQKQSKPKAPPGRSKTPRNGKPKPPPKNGRQRQNATVKQ